MKLGKHKCAYKERITSCARRVTVIIVSNLKIRDNFGDSNLLDRFWDIEANKEPLSLTGHEESIASIAWDVAGGAKVLATACRDRKLRLFDPRAGAAATKVYRNSLVFAQKLSFGARSAQQLIVRNGMPLPTQQPK